MKKSTDELLKILKSKKSVEEYFKENDNEIFFGTLADLVNYFMVKKHRQKRDVVKNSGLKREYCYEILQGKTNKKKSRNKVIMLCFGLELTIDESQQLLKKSGYAPLYVRDTRDSIIAFSLEHHTSVVNTNIKLSEYNLELLE